MSASLRGREGVFLVRAHKPQAVGLKSTHIAVVDFFCYPIVKRTSMSFICSLHLTVRSNLHALTTRPSTSNMYWIQVAMSQRRMVQTSSMRSCTVAKNHGNESLQNHCAAVFIWMMRLVLWLNRSNVQKALCYCLHRVSTSTIFHQ